MIPTKEYLSRAYRIEQRINGKLEQVQALRTLAEKASAVLVVNSTGGGNPRHMETTIAKMIDLEAAIASDLNLLMDTKLEIMTIINCVESSQLQMLLELRYLNFKSWEDIADGMGRGLRNIFHLHGKALTEVDAARRA